MLVLNDEFWIVYIYRMQQERVSAVIEVSSLKYFKSMKNGENFIFELIASVILGEHFIGEFHKDKLSFLFAI